MEWRTRNRQVVLSLSAMSDDHLLRALRLAIVHGQHVSKVRPLLAEEWRRLLRAGLRRLPAASKHSVGNTSAQRARYDAHVAAWPPAPP